MDLKKLTKGSSLLMSLAVVLSASVLVSAYATFSNNVWTDSEDFESLYGLTLSLQDVAGGPDNFDTDGELTHTVDTEYDQGLKVNATDFTGSYDLVINIYCSGLANIAVTDVNSVQIDTGEGYDSLTVTDAGEYLTATIEGVSIAEGEIDNYIFVFNFNTEADNYQINFLAIQ